MKEKARIRSLFIELQKKDSLSIKISAWKKEQAKMDGHSNRKEAKDKSREGKYHLKKNWARDKTRECSRN